MGIYLNPGNEGFQRTLQSEYVDKTGLIALINQTIGTMEKLSCISRPRRFGKSYAAMMLCAYYDCSCDSRGLFDDKEIAGTQGYLTHLNQYHVVYLDITGFLSEAKRQRRSAADVPEKIVDAVHKELKNLHPALVPGETLMEDINCLSPEELQQFGEYLDRIIAAFGIQEADDREEDAITDWMEQARERMGGEQFEQLMSMRERNGCVLMERIQMDWLWGERDYREKAIDSVPLT